MLAAKSPLGKSVFTKPLVAMMEAKKKDFDHGWAQCLAVMLACQKLNADRLTIYGVVTSGIAWAFGRLKRQEFTQELARLTPAAPQRLMGALDFIFAACERQLDAPPASAPAN